MSLAIDRQTERAYKREALQLRRIRLDKSARSVTEYAAKQARREMVERLMTDNRSTF